MPSPAVFISIVALLAALSGGAYAGSGMIGTKQLKNGAVTTKKLKNGAVTAKKIRRGAVTGQKIRDGAVGTAKLADGAVTGTKADTSTFARVPKADGLDVIPLTIRPISASGANQDAARAAATKIPLLTVGPVTLYGKCFEPLDAGGPAIRAEIYLETSRSDLIFEGYSGNSGAGFVGPSTPEAGRIVHEAWNAMVPALDPGAVSVSEPHDNLFSAKHGAGSLDGSLLIGVKRGAPPTGDGPFGAGDRCLFGGVVRSR